MAAGPGNGSNPCNQELTPIMTPTKYSASATASSVQARRAGPRAVWRAVAPRMTAHRSVRQQRNVMNHLRAAEAGEHPHRADEAVHREPDVEHVDPARYGRGARRGCRLYDGLHIRHFCYACAGQNTRKFEAKRSRPLGKKLAGVSQFSLAREKCQIRSLSGLAKAPARVTAAAGGRVRAQPRPPQARPAVALQAQRLPLRIIVHRMRRAAYRLLRVLTAPRPLTWSKRAKLWSPQRDLPPLALVGGRHLCATYGSWRPAPRASAAGATPPSMTARAAPSPTPPRPVCGAAPTRSAT